MEWVDFLDLAERLAHEDTEAARRSAISRAYYATLLSARDHLASQGHEPPTDGSVHRWVWDTLSDARGQAAKLARHGKRLKKLRNDADYKATMSPDANPDYGVRLARNALALLARLK